jgi:hypothetical protein
MNRSKEQQKQRQPFYQSAGLGYFWAACCLLGGLGFWD